MSISLSMTRDALAYRGPQPDSAGQRAASLGAAIGLHVMVIGAFVVMSLKPPITPPEPTITVRFITQTAAAPAPTPPQPPQPTPPPPERQMIATPAPTTSTMTAPPVEAVQQPTPPTPAPLMPAPPAPPSAPTASAAPAPITPPSFTAAYLNNPGPVYPASARRKKEEGVVRLRVQVSTEGSPTQVNVDRSSGSPELDAAAQDVVKRRWKFVAAKQAGVPVTAWVIVPMEFSLKR